MRLSFLLFALVLGAAVSPSTRAAIVYQFTGACTSGPASCLSPTLTVTVDLVDSYVPGSIVGPSDVLSASDSEFGNFSGGSPVPAAGTNVCALQPAAPCSGQNLGLKSSTSIGYFYSYGDGSWQYVQLGSFMTFSGTGANWTEVPAVPIPASAPLLLSGLVGWAFTLRPRRQSLAHEHVRRAQFERH
jgi:hypothetical protein